MTVARRGDGDSGDVTGAGYPAATLADLLELTVRRVQQLAHDGIIPKATHGRYPLVASFRGYVRHLKRAATGADVTKSTAVEKKKLLRAKRETAELEVARLRGELTDVATVTRVVNGAAQGYRDAWLLWPARVSAILAAGWGVEGAQVHRDLEDAVRAHLTELADLTVDGKLDA